MTTLTAFKTRLRIAHWSQLSRWDAKAAQASMWQGTTHPLRPLAEALTRYRAEAPRTDGALADWQLVTVRFDGSMEPRNVKGKLTFKGKLFAALPGHVIYSKIDARNGAIGIIPESLPRVAVSSEFPVYAIRAKVASPAYIKLLFRSAQFQRLIQRLVSGASGRKRVEPAALERLSVPLPPLPVQAAIVEAYETGVAEAARLRQEAARLEAETENYFLRALGIENTYRPKRAKVQVLEWSRLARWSVEAAHEAIHGNGQPTSTLFSMATIGEVGAVSYGIQKAPSNRPGMHPHPYLRVANVKAGYLDLSEIKYINVPDAQFPLFEVLPGDLLFVEGNGSRTELGRAALWNGEIDGCVHQNHLLKVRFDQKKVVPAFASRWFNTETGRGHFFRSAKTSSGLGTINSKEMRLAPIPLPSVEMQLSILEQDSLLRNQAATLRLAAAETEAATVARAERMILGESLN